MAKSLSANSVCTFGVLTQPITELIKIRIYCFVFSANGCLKIFIIVSDSVGSAPLRRSITTISLVITPFVKVFGFCYMFKMWMHSAGTGTTEASF